MRRLDSFESRGPTLGPLESPFHSSIVKVQRPRERSRPGGASRRATFIYYSEVGRESIGQRPD
jgi:hypothetical protein